MKWKKPTVIQDEQQSPRQPVSLSESESHGQALQIPQKDEKGENPHKNNEIEKILENPPSPENNHFPDTFHDTSGLPERSSMPELYVRQDFEKEGDFLHTSEYTCSDLPNNQKLPSSQESGPFLDPLPNARYKTLEKKHQKFMQEHEIGKYNADIHQTKNSESLERQS
ncbi:hypothetical protein JTB14_027181 [Gonioctena quinquepunctata]|nr:hypothetical protein JTB14_027181 [Gonioctena quinquepunctata]